MRDARYTGRTARPLIGLSTVGLAFSLFRKREPKAPATASRVVVENPSAPPLPSPPPQPPQNPLRAQLRYEREEIAPDTNVRTGNLTCPACNTSARYFLNSDGKATLITCRSCGKQFRT